MTGDLIGAGAAVLAALIAVFWPAIQAVHRRYRFKRLIVRELRELEPAGDLKPGSDWRALHRRECIHRTVIEDPKSFLDFILSMNPRLVYGLRQFWAAFERGDAEDWVRRFGDFEPLDKSEDIKRNICRRRLNTGPPAPA